MHASLCLQQMLRTASQKAAAWKVDTRLLIGSGAVAATCSGVLSALSGIGGPPLILMYELLAVPKARTVLPVLAPMQSMCVLECEGNPCLSAACRAPAHCAALRP